MIESADSLAENNGRCFIIAEAGVNHNGDLALARQLVIAAAAAGADAVKFQTFQAGHLVTADAPQADYQARNTGRTESQFDMLKRLELPLEAFAELAGLCAEMGIEFLSTAFDEESADFLAGLGMRCFKIPSGELTNLPFLRHIGAFGRPVIVSTGMGTIEEAETAVATLREAGSGPVTVLHCVTRYPTPAEEANLRAMHVLRHALGVPIGYSDHTEGIEAPVIAVAAGACVIEKHFTLDRDLPGPDHKASLEPGELAEMVHALRRAEVLLGRGDALRVLRQTAERCQLPRVLRGVGEEFAVAHDQRRELLFHQRLEHAGVQDAGAGGTELRGPAAARARGFPAGRAGRRTMA